MTNKRMINVLNFQIVISKVLFSCIPSVKFFTNANRWVENSVWLYAFMYVSKFLELK